jgi:hypothetical protein
MNFFEYATNIKNTPVSISPIILHNHLPILCEIFPKIYVAIINEMAAGKLETAISQIFEFIVFNIQIGIDVSIDAALV